MIASRPRVQTLLIPKSARARPIGGIIRRWENTEGPSLDSYASNLTVLEKTWAERAACIGEAQACEGRHL